MDPSLNPILTWLEDAFDYVKKNKQQVVLSVAGVAALSVGIAGFYFYRVHVQEQAHKALQQAVKYYDGTVGKKSQSSVDSMVFSSEDEKWQKTEQVFKRGYEEHRGASLAPMFLAYQAEAVQNQGRHEEAIKLLADAVDQFSSPAVKDFYRVKLALMKLDCKGDIEKQQGLGALKDIANNAQSVAHESALYYLGAYYWAEKKFADAKTYWQTLLVKHGARDSKNHSHYAEIVKEKLALLSVEGL